MAEYAKVVRAVSAGSRTGENRPLWASVSAIWQDQAESLLQELKVERAARVRAEEALRLLSKALHEARKGAYPITLPVSVVAAWQTADEVLAAVPEKDTPPGEGFRRGGYLGDAIE